MKTCGRQSSGILIALLAAVPLLGQPTGDADWTDLGLGRPVKAIGLDPLFSSTFFASSTDGLFRTVDGGKNWEEAGEGIPAGPVQNIGSSAQAVFVEVGGNVYRSLDSGSSWSPYRVDSMSRTAVKFFASESSTWFVTGIGSFEEFIFCAERGYAPNCNQIHRADARGRSPQLVTHLKDAPVTFAVSTVTVPAYFAGYRNSIWCSLGGYKDTTGIVTNLAPSADGRAYAIVWRGNTAAVLRGDAGSWVETGPGLPPVVRSIASPSSSPDTVYAGTDDGVFLSTDGGLSWAPFGLRGLVIAALATSPNDPTAVYAGTSTGLFVRRTASSAACIDGPTAVCLDGGRFRAEISWRTADGRQGRGQAGRITSDTASFWFFDPDNVEVVVKVLDGSRFNGRHWVFAGALSTVRYEITVTDTETGERRSYLNPEGRLSSFADADAFRSVGALTTNAEDGSEVLSATAYLGPVPPCSADARGLCLRDSRFRVSVSWIAPDGRRGSGQAVPLTSDSGYFWFFNAENVELVVKVLDGRSVNGHHWVFYGALSNVAYTVTVTDTETGIVRTYENPQGNLASFADTSAF
jgi:hypothetical protein